MFSGAANRIPVCQTIEKVPCKLFEQAPGRANVWDLTILTEIKDFPFGA
jgi:hypothetical protein